MTQPSLIINARLFAAVAVGVSNEETRYSLAGVCVQPNPKGPGAVLIATDGHVLVAALDESASLEDVPGAGVLVKCPPALLTAAKKDAKATHLTRAIQVHGDQLRAVDARVNADGTLQTESALPVHIEPGEPYIDGTFPNWRRVLPRGDLKPGTPSSFAPHVLKRCLCAFEIAAGTRAWQNVRPVKFLQADPGGPAILRAADSTLFAVAMPFHDKTNDSDALPNWA